MPSAKVEPRRRRARRSVALLACCGLLSASGCDKVEQTENRTAVGGLQIEKRCLLTTDNRAGHARAELWVWDRASKTKGLSVTRTFVSWSALTAWAGWVEEEPHLCSDYFSDPGQACASATRPK